MSVINIKHIREPELRILENQEIIMYTLFKLIHKNYNQKDGDSQTINALIDCYHETRRMLGKSYASRIETDLLRDDYYED